MDKKFVLLNDAVLKDEIAYELYKSCMYMPTKEKYNSCVEIWLNNDNIRTYGCYSESLLEGIIVVNSQSDKNAELIGISVCEICRGKGVGSYMIQKVKKIYQPQKIMAETDDGAVGFYMKCGFDVSKEIKKYGTEEVVRYHCIL